MHRNTVFVLPLSRGQIIAFDNFAYNVMHVSTKLANEQSYASRNL